MVMEGFWRNPETLTFRGPKSPWDDSTGRVASQGMRARSSAPMLGWRATRNKTLELRETPGQNALRIYKNK